VFFILLLGFRALLLLLRFWTAFSLLLDLEVKLEQEVRITLGKRDSHGSLMLLRMQ
jgi:hypothetical protein